MQRRNPRAPSGACRLVDGGNNLIRDASQTIGKKPRASWLRVGRAAGTTLGIDSGGGF